MRNRVRMLVRTLAVLAAASVLLVFPVAAVYAAGEETTQSDAQARDTAVLSVDWNAVNMDDSCELADPPNGMQVVVPTQYLFALHKRAEAYNHQSVVISGVLYAPAKTQILQVVVTPANGQPYVVNGDRIWRCRSLIKPDAVGSLQFTPDEERAGFAFLADFSGDSSLADGEVPVNVKLIIDQNIEPELGTTVTLQTGVGRYDDLLRALLGQCIRKGDRENDQIRAIRQRLVELGYMDAAGLTGDWDDTAMAAANELLSRCGMETDSESLSSKAVGFIASASMQANGGDSGGFFSRTVDLFGIVAPLWALIVAGLAAVLVILAAVLLSTLKKRRKLRRKDPAAKDSRKDNPPPIADGNKEKTDEKILTVLDETLKIERNEEKDAGLGVETVADQAKQYTLKLRLIFGGQYTDRELAMQEGMQVTIGRDPSAGIRTHPGDARVSQKHGTFAVRQGILRYTDHSRNGTRYNEQKAMRNGDTVDIPSGRKAQLDIGSHKILILLVQK